MINSKVFVFGNNEGEYNPALGYVTDSIFEVAQATGIAFGTQYYSTEISQGTRSLNFSNAGFTPSNGDKMRVDFLNPVIIQNA